MNADRTRREFLTTSLATGVAASSALVLTGAALPARGAQPTDAAAAAPNLELAMMVTADITDAIPLGASPAGARRIIPITGGRFEGPKLKGIILPGGEDAQFDRADGVTVFEARYWLKADDGAVIKVVNRALRDKTYLRTQPTFEAPTGPHDWLNRAIFIGTLTLGAPKQVVLRYFKVL
jgi:hypothetical protein